MGSFSPNLQLFGVIFSLFSSFFLPGCHCQAGGLTTAPVPSNDRCVAAIELTPDVPVQGSNANANFDYFNQAVCGARSDRRAVWYVITGNGNPFTAHLCSNEATKVVNYGVFNECNNQNCHGFPSVDHNVIVECEKDESQPYTFVAEVGSRYFFHIRGPEEGVEFQFIVADDAIRASNNLCSNAEVLPLQGAVKSTTAGSTFDFLSPDFCGKLSNHAGVWYEIMGDGKTHTISLCSMEDDDDDEEIALDFGLFSECGTRSCIGFSENKVAKCENGETIELRHMSEVDVPYYIHVRGERDSLFALRVTTETTAIGDACSEPIPLELGTSIEGDTTGSSFDFVNEAVCGPRSDLPGIWYTITGNGFQLTISVCIRNAGDSVYFSVLRNCGTDNDDACVGFPRNVPVTVNCLDIDKGPAKFTFDTFTNEVYLIHVRSELDAQFTLSVSKSSAPAGFSFFFGFSMFVMASVVVPMVVVFFM